MRLPSLHRHREAVCRPNPVSTRHCSATLSPLPDWLPTPEGQECLHARSRNLHRLLMGNYA